VARAYKTGSGALVVLRDAELTVSAGEMVALVAPSGAGKSTLLHIAGLLEPPDAGEVFISGQATSGLGDKARTSLRRTEIGFVYQFHHLLPEFSALENVVLPQMIAGLSRREAERRGGISSLTSGSTAGRSTGQVSFPAASSSVWRSHAPSPTRRGCCSPTNRPATSIRKRPGTFSRL
jgi:ABC-type lipoprotein export system ATPase subunit